MDIDIPLLTANRHGYWKPIDLLEQLPTYALRVYNDTDVVNGVVKPQLEDKVDRLEITLKKTNKFKLTSNVLFTSGI